MSDISKDDELEEGGDLGLGRGLKPGGIPNVDLHSESDNFTHLKNRPRSPSVPLLNREEKSLLRSQSVRPKDTSPLTLHRKTGRPRRASDGSTSEEFPAFAEVPFGTSLRQQKKLFEQKLSEIFPTKRKSIDAKEEKDGMKVNSSEKVVFILQEKLSEAENDVELLRQDREVCKQQLQSKYLALRALQKQNFAVQSQQIDKTHQAKLINRQLIQELNGLQFQLDYQQSTLMDAQNLWVDRFNRVCDENNALMATLEARSEQMRKMTAEKMAVERERDELLALLDVQERQRYEVTRSQSTAEEQAYNNFTSAELAVLGACRCRNRDPQPCGCAHAAAYMKREICKLRDELESEKEKADNALVTTDAYRMAFEEQLSRNRTLVKQIAELVALPSPQPSKASKAKAALKWLVKQLNEDESIMTQNDLSQNVKTSKQTTREHKEPSKIPSQPSPSDSNGFTNNESTLTLVVNGEMTKPLKEGQASNGFTLQIDELNSMSQPELIDMLTEMISDRSEALAHQRLAAHMLAKRTKELEEKLTAVTDGEDTFTRGT